MGRGSGPRRAFNWEVGETMARSNINATRVLLSIVVGIPSLFFLLFSLLGSFFFPPFLRFGPKLGEKSSRVGWIALPLPSCYNDREREREISHSFSQFFGNLEQRTKNSKVNEKLYVQG